MHTHAAVVRTSPLLDAHGIPHAFTTRRGGVSTPPYDTLSLGSPSELPPGLDRDSRNNIAENWARVLRAASLAHRRLVQVHQVHAGDVVTVTRATPPPRDDDPPRADALATDDPDLAIAVRVADCAPILLASDDGAAVAAIHAGWRGTVLAVARNAVRALRDLTRRPLLAAIGPCIGPDRFEIGADVAAALAAAAPADTPLPAAAPLIRPAPAPGKFLADLKGILARQLAAEGVARIDTIPGCTVLDAADFFSHRRDRGITGRMAAVIGPRREAPT